MRSRVRASVLWGLVGALSFLVLVQGYELVARLGVRPATKVAVGLVVGVAAAGLTYGARGRLETESS